VGGSGHTRAPLEQEPQDAAPRLRGPLVVGHPLEERLFDDVEVGVSRTSNRPRRAGPLHRAIQHAQVPEARRLRCRGEANAGQRVVSSRPPRSRCGASTSRSAPSEPTVHLQVAQGVRAHVQSAAARRGKRPRRLPDQLALEPALGLWLALNEVARSGGDDALPRAGVERPPRRNAVTSDWKCLPRSPVAGSVPACDRRLDGSIPDSLTLLSAAVVVDHRHSTGRDTSTGTKWCALAHRNYVVRHFALVSYCWRRGAVA
jgi:hypothetical protein